MVAGGGSTVVLKDLTDAEQGAVGGIAAVIEALLLQPTTYAKNARQQGLALTLDPRVLYRGIGAALCNEVGQLGLQFGVTGALLRMSIPEDAPQSVATELIAAAGAGALVAVLASPLELVIVQQQRFGGAMLATAYEVVCRHGAFGSGLFRGLGLAMGRDAIYVGGMLGATPIVRRWLMERRGLAEPALPVASTTLEPAGGVGTVADAALTSLAASMLGGVIGALLSHPFDVAKTCMQGDLARATYGGSFEAMRALLRDGGIARLYHGATWRTVNITATVWIANECSLRLPKHIRPAPAPSLM